MLMTEKQAKLTNVFKHLAELSNDFGTVSEVEQSKSACSLSAAASQGTSNN